MAVCLYLQNNFHNAYQSVVKAIEIAHKNSEYLELKTNVELKISQGSNLWQESKLWAGWSLKKASKFTFLFFIFHDFN
jgi:hypothetical protein